jgi:hypothetical protein
MKTARVLAAGFARAIGFIKATITQQPEAKKPTTDHIAILRFMAPLLLLSLEAACYALSITNGWTGIPLSALRGSPGSRAVFLTFTSRLNLRLGLRGLLRLALSLVFISHTLSLPARHP